MSEWIEYTGKTVEEAITQATIELGVPSDQLQIEVIEEGSAGFLGINKKNAVIKVSKPLNLKESVEQFLNKVLSAMKVEAAIDIKYDEEEKSMDIDLSGENMGVLIGKRGQTLDSLQYLVSLVANKGNEEEYVRVKLDTENYRERRKATLENLAKNTAAKVKRTHTRQELEPMNPYERRIIHSALQGDKFVDTHSVGEEPNRRVVIELKKGVKTNSYGSQKKGGAKAYPEHKPRKSRYPYAPEENN